jgi:hypothetical protein
VPTDANMSTSFTDATAARMNKSRRKRRSKRTSARPVQVASRSTSASNSVVGIGNVMATEGLSVSAFIRSISVKGLSIASVVALFAAIQTSMDLSPVISALGGPLVAEMATLATIAVAWPWLTGNWPSRARGVATAIVGIAFAQVAVQSAVRLQNDAVIRQGDSSVQAVERISAAGLVIDGAHFVNSDLTGATFINSTLKNVDFRGANLSEGDFQDARFENVNFSGANICAADFRGADLSQARHLDAVADDAFAIFDAKTKFPPHLSLIDFNGAVDAGNREALLYSCKPGTTVLKQLAPIGTKE